MRDLITAEQQHLAAHPLYAAITTPDRLRIFMGHHVFAVWDFMQLLVQLSTHFACRTVPWTPAPCDPALTRLVNEIVVGEESDEAYGDGYASHFALYLDAMTEAGASTHTVRRFIRELETGGWTVRSALAIADVPMPVEAFVRETMRVVDRDNPIELAATFAYGRERLIPGMFSALLDAGHQLPPVLRYYLERHVELDGGEHGDAAERLVDELIDRDPDPDVAEHRAAAAAMNALRARGALWDAVLASFDD